MLALVQFLMYHKNNLSEFSIDFHSTRRQTFFFVEKKLSKIASDSKYPLRALQQIFLSSNSKKELEDFFL